MRFLDAGESHGKALVAIIEGLPSGLEINLDDINYELYRRQQGYGRGGRMKIETDKAEILSGVRDGKTLASPLTLMIKNADTGNWGKIMDAQNADTHLRTVTQVRPGHADYSGCVKYGFDDARNILERASARETAIRVAVGAVGKSYLKTLGIDIASRVISIGTAVDGCESYTFDEIKSNADKSEVRCLNAVAEKEMIAVIDQAKENKDTLGGEVEIVVKGMPVGIGSHTYYDRKLDYALMGAVGSVQSVKSVAIGQDCSALFGSQAHDKMYLQNGKIVRKTNRAGGIEGGISNGEEIVIRAKLKPIPTVMAGLDTVDIVSKEQVKSSPERSDVCAVPAGAVVIENVVAFTLMQAINDTLGGDIMCETVARMEKLREKRI